LAQDFGFIPTKYIEFETLAEVRTFTQDVAKTGSWQGDQIEGFVVRSAVRNIVDGTVEGKPPYRPGSPFFFKVKFDEPYLLYRQWREVTRVMLPLLSPSKTPRDEAEVWKKVRTKNKRAEVAVYADWVAMMMKIEPELFVGYEKGVVRVRDRFLSWTENEGRRAWKGGKDGSYKLKGAQAKRAVDRSGLPKKFVLVPIAVPGTGKSSSDSIFSGAQKSSGKTLVGLALTKLFGFAHTQSDNVTQKKTAGPFLNNIMDLLVKSDVVFADR
jgi:tRNA ligase